jgi:AcrR family transcriptional regulator
VCLMNTHMTSMMSTASSEQTKQPRDSRLSILKAAVVEFAQHGISGVRMEHIATRSGFNKALVYRYFKSREELYQKVLEYKFDQQLSVAVAVPDDLGDALVYWFDNAAADPRFVQLLQREALHDDGAPLAHEEFRRRYYELQLVDLEARKARGQLDPALPTRSVLLLLSALVTFPAFFPNLARLIVRTNDDDAKAEWRALLREIASRLGPR